MTPIIIFPFIFSYTKSCLFVHPFCSVHLLPNTNWLLIPNHLSYINVTGIFGMLILSNGYMTIWILAVYYVNCQAKSSNQVATNDVCPLFTLLHTTLSEKSVTHTSHNTTELRLLVKQRVLIGPIPTHSTITMSV